MPYYDYHCPHCDEIIEIEHRMGKTATRCPKCGQPDLKRQLHAPNIKFVGSGFYANDYKGK